MRLQSATSSTATPAASSAPAERAEPFEALYQAARQAAELRDEQLAVLAHDLRNPLNALAVSAEVLKRVAPTAPEVLGAVAIIGRQVAKLAALVDLHLPAGGRPPDPCGAPAAAAPRVAVIDRDADAAFRLSTALKAKGHQVNLATDAEDGLTLLLREAPEAALVAIDLQGLDGCDFARCARAAGYAGRLIAVSSFSSAADPERSLAAGFEAHLLTPVPAELLARLLSPR